MRKPVDPATKELIRMAMTEDLGQEGDLSTHWFVPSTSKLRGSIVAKQAGVVCGLDIAREVFRTVSRRIVFLSRARDSELVKPGKILADISGPREILTAERTALNFLQRLSGIATLTHTYADRIKGTPARVLDTRKTIPGWRTLDKYAVRCGGGANHRMGLYDMVMLKDNHLELADGRLGSGGAAAAKERVRKFRATYPKVPVLIEAKTRAQVDLALECGADIVLLDNMPFPQLKAEVRRVRARSSRVRIEVSGGVTLDTIRSVARLGVDRISVGRLTHSAPALDMSLEIHS